ncbi:PspC domain-containing protein [Propionibacteriaceae bacterium Y1923]
MNHQSARPAPPAPGPDAPENARSQAPGRPGAPEWFPPTANGSRPGPAGRPAAVPGPQPPPAYPPPAYPPNLPAVPTDEPPVRRAYRVSEGSWLAGVCTGIAHHLNWPVGAIRIGFVALTFANFIGVFVYGLLWILMPRGKPEAQAPGLEAATRTNLRTTTPKRVPDRRRDAGAITAMAVLGVGVIWAAQVFGLGIPFNWFWPLAFAGVGLALIWKQADAAPGPDKDTNKWVAPLVSTHGWTGITRMIVGGGMIVMAGSAVVASSVGLAQLPALLLLSGVIVGGIGLIAAPWIHRWRLEMQSAREEKLLADARADMAAHLHDSVLQTLALIQRQADDPKAVAGLARRQERELRGWLYDDASPDDTHLAAALKRAGQEIEDERGVPIEVVCVGDTELTTDLSALVSAAREAMMNAAKHSGADKIDVYGEVEDDHVEVYVRDRGKGFDLAEVADDRQGVRASIIGRVERHGGRARITSAPGEGTNITLEMDL